MDRKREMLEQLWDLTIQALISKIQIGDFGTQDLNVARQMLKDHGVSVAQAEDSPIGDLADVLPFSTQSQTSPEKNLETFG